jgi:hypothetical protein
MWELGLSSSRRAFPPDEGETTEVLVVSPPKKKPPTKTVGYGFAFGNDDTSFIAWTQFGPQTLSREDLPLLHEAGEMDKYFSSDQGYDYKIGAAGLLQLEGECDGGDDGTNGF